MTNKRFHCKTAYYSITTIFTVVVMLLFFFTSCGGENKEVVEVVFDPETTYTMKTTDAISLIDSGLTRYRITTQEMLIFDEAKEPYWYFPEGLFAEQLDTTMTVQATLKADTAYNWTKKELWKLIGNVVVENLEGERFVTDTLYFDRLTQRVYSEAYMRIHQKERIIAGIGFESDMNMTHYRIYNPQGTFPVEESTSPTDSTGQNRESRSRQSVPIRRGFEAAQQNSDGLIPEESILEENIEPVKVE